MAWACADLVINGNDVLVLAGPTMDFDGPVFVFRWKDPLGAGADSIAARSDLAKVVTVPFGVTKDQRGRTDLCNRYTVVATRVLRFA